MIMKYFRFTALITITSLILAWLYGGITALYLTAILGILEISFSFDNAIINARIIEKLSPTMRKLFLTLGIAIAVVGTRLLFPLLIVWCASGITPLRGMRMALSTAGEQDTYAQIISSVHPLISAFGGCFLFLLFCYYIVTPQSVSWIKPIERICIRAHKFTYAPIFLTAIMLLGVTYSCEQASLRKSVFIAGLIGIIVYVILDFLHKILNVHHPSDGTTLHPTTNNSHLQQWQTFCYLEIIDASFSLDGVIGAFAITSDPVIIILGLGFIGAVCVRSITMYLVDHHILHRYIYVEHGAHWAIGALGIILLITACGIAIPESITGFIGVGFIIAAVASSIRYQKSRPSST